MQNRISDKNKKELLKFAKKAASLGNKLLLDTHRLTPTNFEEEKEKFYSSNNYNPQFKYKKEDLQGYKEEINQLHIRLNLISLPNDLRNYLKKYLNDLFHLYTALEVLGTNEFTLATKKIFHWDIDNIKNIKRNLPKISLKSSKEKPLDANAIRKEFLKALKEKYRIEDYPLEINNFNSHIISDSLTKLKIGARVKRNPNNVRRLIVHEIESHVLQKLNIKKSQNPLLKLVTYKDRMVYMEGLAVYNEFKTNTITKSAYDIYKARLEAVEISHKSFREIFNHLVKFISADKAYITTYRIKRGLGNTSHPGGLSKDASYLEGFGLIRKMEKNDEDIEKLYLYRVPKLGKLLLKYNLLSLKQFLLPKFNS
ncbi:hypothetical protein A3J17_01300 [Candidatus Curtissbacteria bacterium RIFCSPLOWO2_02_FULL_40_11]|uniref:DUF1704 domain-containing protein n=1 Tax=Candidatus Curtissbacteria bacterium RIFCSPHIGHO2_02_FULL_40_16b TaxID=1797714 RepID=A0A1F5GBE2_9BACT|nr:MAG: hypothetical protein A3D04_03550 [Candidatus Curtissbacteria bacterium RIFCSPHIGHO2_02_FULL_40_16b]OGE00859.1 MAG: hypothetical protein A3J17_01300 [Candidatus Curtissbacteria bacterium RIFCSPLOWO2_02_FULL_40_11]